MEEVLIVRVLVVHRYYYPERVPCASIVRAIAIRLSQDGHQVDVLSAKPDRRIGPTPLDEKEVHECDGVHILRLSLQTEVGRPVWRVINALHIGITLLFKAIFIRYDVIISTSIPPVLGGFFSSIAARLTCARFIYYCMDLHPEIGRISGDFANTSLYRLLLRIDDWNCRQARPVLVHSEDMRNTLRMRPQGAEYDIDILNNFALPTELDASINFEWKHDFKENTLKLIYAGNMGRFQGLETLIEAMGLLAHRDDIVLIMMGDGIEKPSLMALQKQLNANVYFYDYQSVDVAKQAIRSADIGVVMLVSGMYKLAYPSKIMAYLEQGLPIIAGIEEESELAKIMQSEGYGFSVPTGNAISLEKLLLLLADDQSWKEPMNHSALIAYEKYFSSSLVLAKWSKLVGKPCQKF